MIVATVAAGPRLGAQTVRGTVVDPGGQPVVGVIATLLDSASTIVARALSDAAGQFRLSAPRSGVYRVRTLRIGYRPSVSAALELAPGADATRRIVLDAIPLSLDTIRVDDRSVCRSRAADSTAIVFEAWEQVRAAITATELTAGGRDLLTTTVAYERTLDAGGRRIRTQRATVNSGNVRSPWLAQAPDKLRREGYVVASPGDSTTFYAPGLDMLSAPEFVEDHCLRIGRDRDPRLLAIEFEPTPQRRRISEIKGTIWLDRASSELRRLAFSYVNVPPAPSRFAGGEMAFARMRTGGWVISRWSIQMPLFDQVSLAPSVGRVLGQREVRVSEIRVAGGELAAVVSGRDTVWSHPPVTLTGRVLDSLSRDPVVRARVTLQGTPLGGMTDDRGRFAIEGVVPGEYTAELRTPGLDSLNAVQTTPVVVADSAATVEIRALSPRQFEAALCGAQRLQEPGIVSGTVRPAAGDSIPPNTRVTASWAVFGLRQGAAGQGTVTHERRSLDARVASNGLFRLCGVPVNTALSIAASGAGAESPEPAIVTIPPYMRYARAEVAIARVAEGRASFSGTVMIDSTTQPIMGAQVVLPELGRAAVTSETGTFRMIDLPAGTHHVLVRRLGYAPAETELTFGSGQRVVRTIHLARMTVLDSVRVMAETPTDRLMQSFEDHRHVGLGHFLGRPQLAKLEGRTMGSALLELTGLRLAYGKSTQAWVVSSRGHQSLSGRELRGGDEFDRKMHGAKLDCYARVYLNGMRVYSGRNNEPLFDVNTVYPDDLEAVEYYADAAQTPGEYSDLDTTCGVLVLWTRRR